jgi:hypothetical protein
MKAFTALVVFIALIALVGAQDGRWVQVESQFSANPRPFRYGHSCAITTGAKIACYSGIGADGASSSSLTRFNYLSNSKILTLSPNTLSRPSRVQAAYALSQDRYYVAYGGYRGNSIVANPRLVVYDFQTENFLNRTETKVVPNGYSEVNSNHFEFGAYGTSAAVNPTTGDVWLFGGNAILLNLEFITRVVPTTFVYHQIAVDTSSALPESRFGAVFGYYKSGTDEFLWVYGGMSGQGPPNGVIDPSYLSSHAKYNVVTNKWLASPATTGTPPAGRAFMAVSVTKNNRDLICFGGRNRDTIFNDVYRFNMATGAWTTLNPTGTKPPSRDRSTAMLMRWVEEESILFYAGADANSGALDDFWRLIFQTNNSSPILAPPDIITSSDSSTVVVLPSASPSAGISFEPPTPTPTPPPILTSGAALLESWISLLL